MDFHQTGISDVLWGYLGHIRFLDQEIEGQSQKAITCGQRHPVLNITGRVRPSGYNYHTTVQFVFSNNEMQYSSTLHRGIGTKAFEKLAQKYNGI